MRECYDDAAVRHFRDGEHLKEKDALDNADQLFGFAVECALKSVLVSLPGCLEGDNLARTYKEHVDTLWGRIRPQGLQRRYPVLMTLLGSLQNPFSDWSTDQRYGPDGAVGAETLSRHREAARRILGSARLIGQRRR